MMKTEKEILANFLGLSSSQNVGVSSGKLTYGGETFVVGEVNVIRANLIKMIEKNAYRYVMYSKNNVRNLLDKGLLNPENISGDINQLVNNNSMASLIENLKSGSFDKKSYLVKQIDKLDFKGDYFDKETTIDKFKELKDEVGFLFDEEIGKLFDEINTRDVDEYSMENLKKADKFLKKNAEYFSEDTLEYLVKNFGEDDFENEVDTEEWVDAISSLTEDDNEIVLQLMGDLGQFSDIFAEKFKDGSLAKCLDIYGAHNQIGSYYICKVTDLF